MTRPRVLAIVNQKGGVGKTTTSINLGTALAAVGRRVLIVDFDAQGNASTGLGISRADRLTTSYDLVVDRVPMEEAVLSTLVPRLDIVPGDENLSGVETELAADARRSYRLREVIYDYVSRVNAEHLVSYDYILIDCPPSLNMLTLNAMVASHSVLIPMQCEYYALEGLSALMSTLRNIRDTVNPGLHLEGILRTMFDNRSNLTKDVSDQLLEYFPDKVFRTCVPRNVRLAEAPSHGMPIIHYDNKSRGAMAYIALAGEMIRKEGKK